MQGTTLLLTWRQFCKSHAVDFEEDKIVLECENCELKNYCFVKKRPFLLSNEDIIELEKIIRGGI